MDLKKFVVPGVLIILLVVLCGGACSTYNTLATEEQNVNQAWANVQSAYQRRHDLIPNLVATVKGYAQHEKSTYTELTAARAGKVETAGDELLAASQATTVSNGPNANSSENMQKAYENADNAFNTYINAVHEAYPELKANEQFMDLQQQLEGTENRINTERNRYNEAVRDFNVKVVRFPANIFARLFGFNAKQMFEADASAQAAPVVNFND